MTEFGRYLKQCPPALKDKTRTLSLLKDALKNDLPKFRVLQAAYVQPSIVAEPCICRRVLLSG